MNNLEVFLNAIQQKNIVRVRFDSHEKGIIERECVPFDFGPSRRNLSPNPDRCHFYDLDSPEGQHTLSVLPEQLIIVEDTGRGFDPAVYVTWRPPYKWFVPRDWGMYS